MIYLFIFSFIATILITFLGALLGNYSKKFPKWILSILHSFSLGVMLVLLFLELFPESYEGFVEKLGNNTLYSVLLSLGIATATFLIFFVLHHILDKIIDKFHGHHHDHKDENKLNEEVCDDHLHANELLENKVSLLSSFIYLLAIFIHNIPEGFTLGTFFNVEGFPIEGFLISISLLFHNFIIGYSMGTSFANSNKSKKYSLFFSTLSALPAFIFAIVGYFLSINLDPVFVSTIFAISFGSLFYVIFKELLPQAFLKYHSNLTPLYILLGFALGAILIFI